MERERTRGLDPGAAWEVAGAPILPPCPALHWAVKQVPYGRGRRKKEGHKSQLRKREIKLG